MPGDDDSGSTELEAQLEQARVQLENSRRLGQRRQEAVYLNMIGWLLISIGLVEEAYDYLEKSRALAEALGEVEVAGAAVNGLGAVHSDRGEFEEAGRLFEQALALSTEAGSLIGQASVHNSLAKLSSRLGDLERSEAEYMDAIEVAGKAGDRVREAEFKRNLGELKERSGDLRTALTWYSEALVLAEEAGALSLAAHCLHNTGSIHNKTGNLTSAMDAEEGALRLAKQTGDLRLQASVLNSIGFTLESQGEMNEVRPKYQAALDIATEIGAEALVATCLNNLAHLDLRQGHPDSALTLQTQALEIAERLSDLPAQFQYLLNLSAMHSSHGDHQEARRLLEASADLAAKSANPEFQARVENAKARLLEDQGQLQEAMSGYRRAADLIDGESFPELKATCLNNLALSLLTLKRREDARQILGEALDLTQQVQDVHLKRDILHSLASIESEGDEGREASFEEGLRAARALGNRKSEFAHLRSLGQIAVGAGDVASAEDYHAKALALANDLKSPKLQAVSLSDLGVIQAHSGRNEEARNSLVLGLSLADRSGSVEAQMDLRLSLAAFYTSTGAYDEAHPIYGEAIELLELMRGSLAFDEDRKSFVSRLTSTYDQHVDVALRSGHVAEAFEQADRGRSRLLLESMGIDRPLLEDVVPDAELHKYTTLKEELLSATSKQDSDGDISTMFEDQDARPKSEISQIIASVQTEVRSLTERYPQLAAKSTVGGVSLSDVQSFLPPRSAILEFALAGSDPVVFIVRSDGFPACLALDLRPDDARAALFTKKDDRVQYKLEAADDKAIDGLEFLRKRLINPLVGAGVLEGVEDLYIVPFGLLHWVPWPALVRRVGNDRYLIEDFATIVVLPSSSALPLCKRHRDNSAPRDQALVIANPDGSLSGAHAEGNRVSAMYNCRCLAEGTTREAFRTQSSERGMIHLAAHGSFDGSAPLASGLHFADGRLTAMDIINHYRIAADLVVLGSCYGGFGSPDRADEIVGLSSAFIQAGAAGVVAPLYAVDDDLSQFILTHLHEHYRGGSTKALALAEAQRESIREGLPVHSWAPFRLLGDPG